MPLAATTSATAPFNLSVTLASMLNESTASASIAWQIASAAEYDHFVVALFRKLLSNKNKAMFERLQSRNVSAVNWTSRYETKLDVNLNEKYVVKISGFHDKCWTSVNKSFILPAFLATGLHSKDRHSNSLLKLAVIVAAVTTAITLLYMGCFVRKRWYRRDKHAMAYAIDYCRYRATKPNDDALFAQNGCLNQSHDLSIASQYFNIHYVEKEVQQARDSGLVDHYEIHSSRLIVGPEIGKGAFGRVCIAKAESIAGIPGQVLVAVKFLREGSDEKERNDFLSEMSMMKKCGRHLNVVAMLGCCTLEEPFCMVMEYLSFGDLLKYLRKLRLEYERSADKFTRSFHHNATNYDRKMSEPLNNGFQHLEASHLRSSKTTQKYYQRTDTYRNSSISSKSTEETLMFASDDSVNVNVDGLSERLHDVLLDPTELQNFAIQIANGMNHLAKKRIVHRDLAARNILMGENKTLKISDFGLSRCGVYVTQRSGGRVPLRWLSIEAIRNDLYSTESDVWAYGVVLWEICTLGGFPYASVADKNVFGYLVSGHRLEKPMHCSQKLYKLMESCWKEHPQNRPSFEELCHTLEKMTDEPHTYVNFGRKASCELPPIYQEDDKQHSTSKTNLPELL